MLNQYRTFTSFSTSDLEAAREFYGNKLGLQVVDEVDGVLIFQAGFGTKFMVYIKDNHTPATYTVLNFEVEDVESVVRMLNEKGIKMEQYPEMGTNELGIAKQGNEFMAWFKDPAGNIIGLMTA